MNCFQSRYFQNSHLQNEAVCVAHVVNWTPRQFKSNSMSIGGVWDPSQRTYRVLVKTALGDFELLQLGCHSAAPRWIVFPCTPMATCKPHRRLMRTETQWRMQNGVEDQQGIRAPGTHDCLNKRTEDFGLTPPRATPHSGSDVGSRVPSRSAREREMARPYEKCVLGLLKVRLGFVHGTRAKVVYAV